MLEHNDKSQTLEPPKDKLLCEIKLPDQWREDCKLTGPLPSRLDDRRRFPRFHYRVAAILQCQDSFPKFRRPRELHSIYTTDISRGGLAFLHSQELFPKERVRVSMRGGSPQELEVVRCRYLHDHCFLVGCRFLAELDTGMVRAFLKTTEGIKQE